MNISTNANAIPRLPHDGIVASSPALGPAGADANKVSGRGDSPAADQSSVVQLSAAGIAAAAADRTKQAPPDEPATGDDAVATSPAEAPGELDPAEREQLAQLKARDREVRAHEQAHQAVAGTLATGGASFSYQRGPDGINYAVGGEVAIALRKGRTPEETIANAQTIRAAALAPADPSPQDRSIAAAATQMEAEARSETATQDRQTPPSEETGPGTANTAANVGPLTRSAFAASYAPSDARTTGFRASA